jgi:murein DD-endopeptidase MepM/ murein hydrolase activator NlpD
MKYLKRFYLPLLSIIGLTTLFIFSNELPFSGLLKKEKPNLSKLGSLPLVIPTIKYGFAIDTFSMDENTVKNGDVIGNILNENGVDAQIIHNIMADNQHIFKPSNFRVGEKYTLFKSLDGKELEYLVYEPNVYHYFVFNFIVSIGIKKIERPVTKKIKTTSGTIESSIWNAMAQQGSSPELIAKLEDALQWSIDFYHLQKGEKFKIVYESHNIEGKEIGAGLVLAAKYEMEKNTINAIYYSKPAFKGYYDLEGRPLNKGFLRSPLRFSRISSYFNTSRLHPILRRVRPHFGTDYAAPHGTPIMSVGNGVVLEARYSGGNGNYVKIKHDKQHTTQYLHMSRIGPGIRSGAQVQQGQTIGFVGSTGLATGPHVCFRFWKNGQQVNHLRLSFPPPEPLPKEEISSFNKEKEGIVALLN